MKKYLACFFCLCLIKPAHTQILLQDFEGPLGAWSSNLYSNGALNPVNGVVSSHQNISPHQGGGMYLMDNPVSSTVRYRTLVSPQFTLQSGAKYLSLWVCDNQSEAFVGSFDVYMWNQVSQSITTVQNNALQLISNYNAASFPVWNRINITIPAGYVGGQYLYFYTPSYSNSSYWVLLDDILISTTDPTGVDEINFSHDFKVYPNPANGGSIYIAFAKAFQNIRVELSNIEGSRLYEEQFNVEEGENIKLDAPILSAGIYFIKLSDGDKQSTKKIVIH